MKRRSSLPVSTRVSALIHDRAKPVQKSWNHELIRSWGVFASVIFSSISLVVACYPKPERVTVDPAEITWVQEPMQPMATALLPLGNRTLVGPFYWRVTFNNQGDRAVSFKDVQPMIEDNKMGRYFVSGAFGGAFQEDRVTQALPLTVPPYESKTLIIKGSLPGWIGRKAQTDCYKPGVTLSDFNRCSMNTGIDIFGNKLDVQRDGERFIGAIWPKSPYQPALVLKFVSGSGKIYETKATVLPIFQ